MVIGLYSSRNPRIDPVTSTLRKIFRSINIVPHIIEFAITACAIIGYATQLNFHLKIIYYENV